MYSAFVHMHPTPAWLCDLQTMQIVHANRAASDFFGQDGSLLHGMSMETLTFPEDRQHLDAHMDRARRGEAFCEVCRVLSRSGKVQDVVLTCLPVKVNSQPHVLLTLHGDSVLQTHDDRAICDDDVRADKQRLKHPELPEAAVDNQHDMPEISEVADGGEDLSRLISVNAAFETGTGYTSDEVIGRQPMIHNGPLTDPAELTRIREAILGGTGLTTEAVNYRKDGSTSLKEADLLPIRNGKGQITNWVAKSRDITAPRAIEMALRASQERSRLVSLATRDVVWDRDIQLNKVWWNENLLQVFGYDSTAPDVLTPDWWPGIVHPDDADRVVSSFRTALATDNDGWEEAYRFRRKDGSYAHVSDRAHMSRDTRGHVVRAVGCIADQTDQKALAAKVAKAQIPQSFTHLIGGIAHDLNNLLTVIIGNAEQVAEDPEIHPRHADMAEIVIVAAESASKLTSELFSFSREQELDPVRADLNALLR